MRCKDACSCSHGIADRPTTPLRQEQELAANGFWGSTCVQRPAAVHSHRVEICCVYVASRRQRDASILDGQPAFAKVVEHLSQSRLQGVRAPQSTDSCLLVVRSRKKKSYNGGGDKAGEFLQRRMAWMCSSSMSSAGEVTPRKINRSIEIPGELFERGPWILPSGGARTA